MQTRAVVLLLVVGLLASAMAPSPSLVPKTGPYGPPAESLVPEARWRLEPIPEILPRRAGSGATDYTTDPDLVMVYFMEGADYSTTLAQDGGTCGSNCDLDVLGTGTLTEQDADHQQGTYSTDWESSTNAVYGRCVGGTCGTETGLTGDISWGGWLKPESVNSRRALTRYSSSQGYYLQTRSSGNDFICRVDDNSTGDTTSDSGNNIANDGQWHHVVCVYDDTAGELSIYVDGSHVETNSGANLGSVATEFRIGGTSNTVGWDGKLDELFLFSRELTAAEVSEIHTSGIKGDEA